MMPLMMMVVIIINNTNYLFTLFQSSERPKARHYEKYKNTHARTHAHTYEAQNTHGNPDMNIFLARTIYQIVDNLVSKRIGP
jgi:hypothetical protein